MMLAMHRRHRFGLALASLLAFACSAQAPQDLVIRPEALPFDPARPDVPDDAQLLKEIAAAHEFRLGSNFDRHLDAIDPGEAAEHSIHMQRSIDGQVANLDLLFAFGDELFEYEFRVENGLGNQLRGRPGVRAGTADAPNMRRVHKAGFGGPDSFSCSTCHSKGGPDGAGANTQNAYFRGNGDNANTADERSAPHLLGLGPISALGVEMTSILQATRAAAVAKASLEETSQDEVLEALGVSFGRILVDSRGQVDSSFVKGVDADLVVRPFGWKGHHATIRGIAEESFRIHMGLVSMREQAAMRDGLLDKIDYGDGTWFDMDRDGSSVEVEDGMLTTIVAYLSQLEIPVVRPPQGEDLLAMFSRGEQIFGEVGCGQCHRPTLFLSKPIVEVRAAEPQHADRPPILINVALDGEHPKVDPTDALGTSYKVHLFSDLRRHDMGEELTSGYKQGHLSKSVFLTRPLWGLADTAPYLHDGRAPTVHDAILWHGGDAKLVRDLYRGLDEIEQQSLQVFLLSLDREPSLFVP